jgi:hypothetical protein
MISHIQSILPVLYRESTSFLHCDNCFEHNAIYKSNLNNHAKKKQKKEKKNPFQLVVFCFYLDILLFNLYYL